MTTSPIAYPLPTTRRYMPSMTLAAALLLIVLFGVGLLALNQRGGSTNGDSGMSPAGLAVASPTLSEASLVPDLMVTATPIPVSSQIPPTVSPGESLVVTATPIPLPPSAPAGELLPDSVKLDGIRYEGQGWNNQGPANLAMALSYWGREGDQTDLAAWLKPDSEDKSVAPWQITYYVNTFTDFRAITRMGGTMTLMKHLLAAGFPVIVRQGFEPEGEDWLGHDVLLVGYDESQGHFLTYDSYLGSDEDAGRPQPYGTFDEHWRHFNRTFIVVYDPVRELDLWLALHGYADPAQGAWLALDAARQDVNIDPGDMWGWFNMGTSYVALGEYANAVTAYDQALTLDLPWRMLWYQFGPFEAYFRTGDYNTILALADSVLATTEYVEEVYFWQMMVYLATDPAEGDAPERAFNALVRANRNYLIALMDHYHLGDPADFDLIPTNYDAGSEPWPVPDIITATPALELPTPIPPPSLLTATAAPSESSE